MPGVPQRVGRGIALLFHDHGTKRGWVVSSTPWPHFNPGKDPVPILQEAIWAPGPVWTGEKSHSYRDSIPDRPARSQSLYRLSYPAYRLTHKTLYILPINIVVSDQYTPCTLVRPVHTLYISQTSTHPVHQSDQYTPCTLVRPVHTLDISYFTETTGMTNHMILIRFYELVLNKLQKKINM